MKLLLIEDDDRTADYIVAGLSKSGHLVDRLANGRDGLIQAMAGGYDILIVDRMLPGLDGLSLVRTLRDAKLGTPVLFLTALDGVDDRVAGLNAGADDYLVKPFAFSELSARLAALARRPQMQDEPTVLKVADLEMDLIRRRVTRGGQPLDLQPREFRLLEHLVRTPGGCRPGRCCSRPSGTCISIRRPTSSRAMSAGCAPRSTSLSPPN